jgi:hypothetical protein
MNVQLTMISIQAFDAQKRSFRFAFWRLIKAVGPSLMVFKLALF